MLDRRTEQFFTDLPLVHPMDIHRPRMGKRWNGDAVWTGDDNDVAIPDDCGDRNFDRLAIQAQRT